MGGSGISGDLVAVLAAVPGNRPQELRVASLGANRPPARGRDVLHRQHRGNAERRRSGDRPWADSRRWSRSGGKLGEMAAANGWPIVTVPGGLQPRAALGYMLGSSAAPGRGCGRSQARRSGGGGRPGRSITERARARPGSRPRRRTPRPDRDRLRDRRSHRSDRAALEDPDQRERQMARVVQRDARARSQRDRFLDLVVGGDEPPRRDHQPQRRLREPRIDGRSIPPHLPAHRARCALGRRGVVAGGQPSGTDGEPLRHGRLGLLELAQAGGIDPVPRYPSSNRSKQLLAKES